MVKAMSRPWLLAITLALGLFQGGALAQVPPGEGAAPMAAGEGAEGAATEAGGLQAGDPAGADASPQPVAERAPVVAPPRAPQGVALKVDVPDHSDGLSLKLSWTKVPGAQGYALLRQVPGATGWTLVADGIEASETETLDLLTTDPRERPPPETASYRLAVKDGPAVALGDRAVVAKAASLANPEIPALAVEAAAAQARYEARLLGLATPAVTGDPEVSWFNTNRLPNLILILTLGALILLFTRQARQGKELYIRRIPGVDAIEEAVGRATEMGRPILYVPGIGEFQEIQTIASLLILGRVAEIVATYDTDIIVPCTYPIVREVADESVRQGYYQAGRPDAFKPQNVRFISSEQFAFTASTNGIILREKPAANIFLGQFFAESLILAETGFVNESIQIAGTCETTQIPFFVTACDYTLIGEEIYAVSAYLTREPRLTSSLKAADWIRIALIVLLFLGTLLLTLGYPELRDLLANQ